MRTFKIRKNIFLLCLLSGSLLAQSNPSDTRLNQFVQNIEQFRRVYPQEKVYLHFDNTGYFLGEIIWFKAYVVNACDNTPKVVSKVLYVELLNSRGIVLETKKLEIINGQCHGDFYLNTFNYDYHPGYYELRAYTRNMLNFGVETVFSRVLPVFNQPKNEGDYTAPNIDEGKDVKRLSLQQERKTIKKQKTLNIDYYPEGGNLLKGVNNRVAFKITDEFGEGIEATGTVFNDKNEVISEFNAQHEGMGVFNYLPDGGKNKVEIRYKNRTYKFEAPQSISTGYTIQVNPFLAKDILLTVDKSQGLPEEALGVSIMCRGKISYFMTIQANDYPVAHRIPKSELTAGVNQITLFNTKGEVYAERMIFIYPDNQEYYYIKIKADRNSYKWKQRVNLEFNAQPGMTFSLAVRDAATTPKAAESGNILTDLLLSSDLKGCIENPTYYFASKDIEHTISLDLLMMVQGWRRYQWQQMVGITPFKLKYEPEKMLTLNGHLEGKGLNIQNIKEVNVEIALDKSYLNASAKIDESGRFSVNIDTVIYGNHYMFLNADELKTANRSIRLDRWFSPIPKTYSIYETSHKSEENEADNIIKTVAKKTIKQTATNKIIEEADSIGGYHEIKEVTVTEKNKRGKDLVYNVEQDRDKAIDSGQDYPENAFYYLLEKNNGYFFKGALDLPDNVCGGSGEEQWLQYSFDFRYMINDTKWKYISKDSRYPTLHGNKTAFVDLEQIKKIVIREWEQKHAYSTVQQRAFASISGCLYPYDKTTYYLLRATPSYRVTSFEGYSRVKDFYVGRPERENYIPTKTDHSRTLYWNPDVKMDSLGNAKVSFINNAFCKNIDISAEGVSKNGMPMVNR